MLFSAAFTGELAATSVQQSEKPTFVIILADDLGYGDVGLPINEKTIADRLNDQGYVNGLIGKWHLGDEEHFHPTKRGFNEVGPILCRRP